MNLVCEFDGIWRGGRDFLVKRRATDTGMLFPLLSDKLSNADHMTIQCVDRHDIEPFTCLSTIFKLLENKHSGLCTAAIKVIILVYLT